jgi:hypothetical protein
MASRKQIKQALKTVLQGVPGVKSVYTNLPRNQQGMDFPSIVIQIEKSHEKAVSMGNPGRRQTHYTVTLYIQTIDPDPNEQASQERFDDLLDAIDDVLRANKDLNGTVLQSAWSYIDTDVLTPQLAGQGMAILMRAIKTFEVTTEIVA